MSYLSFSAKKQSCATLFFLNTIHWSKQCHWVLRVTRELHVNSVQPSIAFSRAFLSNANICNMASNSDATHLVNPYQEKQLENFPLLCFI